MIRFKSIKQLSITEFQTPFEINLDPQNRWVRSSQEIPWDDLSRVYYNKLNQLMGARALDARVVIGAMIVKHRMKLSDVHTIEYIRENIYVQYFLGLSAYTYNPIFDSSLFDHIRKRLGLKEFEDMTVLLMKKEESKKDKDKDNDEDLTKRDPDNNITHRGTI